MVNTSINRFSLALIWNYSKLEKKEKTVGHRQSQCRDMCQQIPPEQLTWEFTSLYIQTDTSRFIEQKESNNLLDTFLTLKATPQDTKIPFLESK